MGIQIKVQTNSTINDPSTFPLDLEVIIHDMTGRPMPCLIGIEPIQPDPGILGWKQIICAFVDV